MSIAVGDIAKSLNGRDAGMYFVIVGHENEYAFIANGKNRKIEKPKKKKTKHIRITGKTDEATATKLACGEKVTNNDIRRALIEYMTTRNLLGGM